MYCEIEAELERDLLDLDRFTSNDYAYQDLLNECVELIEEELSHSDVMIIQQEWL